MYALIVILGWLYVALMMALAEGLSAQGSWLGAFFTFVLYGLLPVAIIGYILATPARRRAHKAAAAAAAAEAVAASTSADERDGGRHAAGAQSGTVPGSDPGNAGTLAANADATTAAAAVAPERKEA